MADRIQTFTTKIFLNDDQAKNKIRELEKSISTIRADMSKAADAGDWSKFNSLKKDLNQSTKELNSMRTTAQSLEHVLNNLGTSSIKEIKRTISAINKELASGNVARNSQEWEFLTEQLDRAKKELRNVNQANELVNKKDKWQWLENMNKIGFAITNFFGLEQGVSGILSKVTSLAQESMDVAKKAEGIEIAFRRINKPGLLENLRKETHNTVNDMQLMQQAVKFANFDLPVEQLGKLLAFAQQQAKDTGESLDYMVNSLVDGMTRQSPKILDNLGLSAQKIKEKTSETGDFVQGVISIIQERMEKTGGYAETAADRAAKANARMVNAQMELGKQLSPIRAEMAGIFGKAKLGMIETITWILKNRSAIAGLAKALGVVATAVTVGIALDKYYIITQKLKAKWVGINIALHKSYAATILLLRSAIVPLQAAFALLTRGVKGYTTVMRAARMANMTNPWTALATVISVVGVAIYGLVKASKESTEALKVQSSASVLASMKARDLSGIQNDAAKSAVTQKEKVQQLTKIVEDNTKKTKDRMDAAKQLQNIVPGYFATLDTEGAKYRSNTKAINDYIAMLDQVALARAINKKLEENAAKQIDEAKAIDAWEKGIAKRNKIIKNQKEEMRKAASETHWYDTWDNGMAARGELAVNHAAVDKSKSQLEYDKARLKVHQNINKALQEENKWLRDYLNKNVSTEAQLMAINDKDFGNSLGNDTSVNGKSGKTGSGKVSSNTTPKEAPATRLKNQLDHELALEEQSYQQGDITYKTYLADKEALQTAYYEKLKALYKKDSDEYNKVCDEQAKTLADTMGEIRKDTEEGYERERQTVAAKLKAAFYDPTAEAFQNQQQLDEALFKNEMHYYDQRLTLYKEGTKEFERIQAERDAKDEERRQKRQQEWLESYNRFKGQFRKQSLAEQEAEQKATIKAGLDYIVSVYKEKMKSLDKDSAEYKRLEAELEALKAEYEQWLADTETEYARKRNEERSNQAQDNKEMSDAAARGFDKAGLSDNPVASPNGFTGTQGIIGVAGTIGTALGAFAKLREAKKKNLIDDQEWADAKEQLWKNLWNNLPDMAKAAWDTIQTFGQADVAYTQANCDYKVAMISKEYEQRISKAGNNSAKVEKLEKERDKKIAAEKNKANKKAMRMEIAQATVQTAEAAISAYKSAAAIPMVGHILAPIAAAAALAYGAMQVATIKKQHQAEAAGYYEGGFTGGNRYRREAGVVHEGEFVANHNAVNNPQLLPALRLIDVAQRNNTVGRLTATDVSRAMGVGGATVVSAPTVNVQTNNSELAGTLQQARDTLEKLGSLIDGGITANVSMENFKKQEKHWNQIQKNK
ncbi:MAG: hypothetical protein SOY06_03695 [Prevotella sp.]|nr:hypothetical protein [Bacteroidales bacterium]MDY4228934.1 hypothetical protein [Prevotella sp.]